MAEDLRENGWEVAEMMRRGRRQWSDLPYVDDLLFYGCLCCDGTFYEYLQEIVDLGRDKIKKAVFRDILFGKLGDYRPRLLKAFQYEFPKVYQFIYSIKKTDYRL